MFQFIKTARIYSPIDLKQHAPMFAFAFNVTDALCSLVEADPIEARQRAHAIRCWRYLLHRTQDAYRVAIDWKMCPAAHDIQMTRDCLRLSAILNRIAPCCAERCLLTEDARALLDSLGRGEQVKRVPAHRRMLAMAKTTPAMTPRRPFAVASPPSLLPPPTSFPSGADPGSVAAATLAHHAVVRTAIAERNRTSFAAIVPRSPHNAD